MNPGPGDTGLGSPVPQREVRAVTDDSRCVEPGDVFVAVRGMRSDGHEFIATAIERGAAAIVVDHEIDLSGDQAGDRAGEQASHQESHQASAPILQIVVDDTALALGALVARLAGRPGDRMSLVGITGTNGKTTTTFLIEAMLAAAEARPGIIGTVSYRYDGETHPAPYTTPTPQVLHGVFGDMASARCSHAVLEVSSAALSMGRLGGVELDIAAFTNLSQDHLDVHQTMAAYREAKALIFANHLKADGVAVINIDDPAAEHMIAAAGERRVLRVTSTHRDADVQVIRAESSIAGIHAEIATPRGTVILRSPALLGAYNVANLAMAVAICEALGVDHDAMTRGIAAMAGVPGRVERVSNDHGLDILVDYAHTPDALANVLDALQPLTARRLICVFGCGGDRDPSKRPSMGEAVATRADLAVVTSDNPRTEEPADIIDMILPAVPDPFHVDSDRRTAIRAAVAEAVPGDIVLIAGKGHEDYQILGTEKIHFDDREEAARAVALRQDFPLADVLSACDGRLLPRAPDTGPDHRPETQAVPGFSRVIIDGRIAAPGDLYVAIRGERFDGHDFCAQAIAAGATGAIVEESSELPESLTSRAGDSPGGAAIIEVGDGRRALGAVARWHRRRWRDEQRDDAPGDDAPGAPLLVGITGSAGKTTTKELTRAALSACGRVHATAGSLNNETGVPLSLLGLRPFHDFAVIEMGMRGLGEIDYLTRIAEPDVGVVVNAGVAHVGVVGSVEAIARGKSEIFGHLPPHGVAILPSGDPRLAEHASGAPRRLTFGTDGDADVRLTAYHPVGPSGADVTYVIHDREHTLRLPLIGEHNALNGACALAIALACGVAIDRAIAGLARARATAMRSEITTVSGRHVLVDCYNANPASTRAALRALAELRARARAVAVLGDMLELGDAAPGAHRDMGRAAAEQAIDVIALGEHRDDLLAGAGQRGHPADDPRSAATLVLSTTRPGDWVLIKASRGARLERVLDAMREMSESSGKTT